MPSTPDTEARSCGLQSLAFLDDLACNLSFINLVERVVPRSERNAVLGRLSGKLSYLKLGPWEVLDFIAEEHFVEKERDEYE